MARAPLPPNLATRGTTTQNPFLPAGFEEELQKLLDEAAKTGDITIDTESEEPGKFLGEGKKYFMLYCNFNVTLLLLPIIINNKLKYTNCYTIKHLSLTNSIDFLENINHQ